MDRGRVGTVPRDAILERLIHARADGNSRNLSLRLKQNFDGPGTDLSDGASIAWVLPAHQTDPPGGSQISALIASLGVRPIVVRPNSTAFVVIGHGLNIRSRAIAPLIGRRSAWHRKAQRRECAVRYLVSSALDYSSFRLELLYLLLFGSFHPGRAILHRVVDVVVNRVKVVKNHA
ncbi:MAG: hypothetical protein M1404_02375, partial [Acidobacteria bacterium]|nr:hypothetical protein [Acidobacteriota bacterium]